jgi:hypothetical protein
VFRLPYHVISPDGKPANAALAAICERFRISA